MTLDQVKGEYARLEQLKEAGIDVEVEVGEQTTLDGRRQPKRPKFALTSRESQEKGVRRRRCVVGRHVVDRKVPRVRTRGSGASYAGSVVGRKHGL